MAASRVLVMASKTESAMTVRLSPVLEDDVESS
jgi:hypothetical protein